MLGAKCYIMCLIKLNKLNYNELMAREWICFLIMSFLLLKFRARSNCKTEFIVLKKDKLEKEVEIPLEAEETKLSLP